MTLHGGPLGTWNGCPGCSHPKHAAGQCSRHPAFRGGAPCGCDWTYGRAPGEKRPDRDDDEVAAATLDGERYFR